MVRVHASRAEVYSSSQTRCPECMLAHCSRSSISVPGGNTGEIKAVGGRNWPHYLTC